MAAERRRAIDDAAFDVAMETVGEVVEEELEAAAEDGIRYTFHNLLSNIFL